jgi:RsiW-degrading membrane proteinase PrsW (M82 family)
MDSGFFGITFSIATLIVYLKALLIGSIPSLVWLLFWLQEDKDEPEPRGLIATAFISGMLAVLLVLPIQKFIMQFVTQSQYLLIAWASAEEIIKFVLLIIIIKPTGYIDEPIDFAIYMIIIALGFAALENTLYIIKPLLVKDSTVVFLTGNLRFMGSTLLHVTASGLIGMTIGLSFYQNKFIQFMSALFGICLAILLHSTFNLFIMKGEGETTLQIFIFLWVVTVITILIFEKLRRMGTQYVPLAEQDEQTYV